MKKRPYLIPGVLLVAAVGGVVWWSPWEPREPVYDGKPLTYWLASLPQPSNARDWPDMVLATSWANQAQTDPNAVPHLVAALKKYRVRYYKPWVWPILPRSARAHYDNPTARGAAAILLGRMGPAAKPAVPTLIRVLGEDEAAPVRQLAAEALGNLGTGEGGATAALTIALADDVSFVRRAATNALWRNDPKAAVKAGVMRQAPVEGDRDANIAPP